MTSSMLFGLLSLFLLVILFIAARGDDDLRVSTSSGLLKGKRGIIRGKKMKLFLGVPYATPPVGDLRFKPPVPVETKSVERNAEDFAPICYQPPHVKEVMSPLLNPNKAELSEDCLYLNLYIPDTHENELLPVMVWIAGEGFNYADPQQFDGNYLSSQGKLILVTVSYRVSVFGFLSALHSDAPGNVGLLDQRMALRWIQENIENFGGNKDKVTLFGRFTGAMSAAIHAFSPLSKEEKLFHRVILHSGVPDGEWIFDRNPLNATFALAQATDCVFSSMSETVKCFKRLTADVLLRAALSIPHPWRPVLDFSLIYEPTLKAAAKSNYNPIDVMIGLNSDEGSLCITGLKAMKSDLYDKIIEKRLSKDDFKLLIESRMMDIFKGNDDFVNKLAVYNYMDSDVSKLNQKFVDFCGDLYVTAHSEKLADVLSKSNKKVFMYELAHRPSFSNHPSFIQAAHGDDVLYVLGLPLQLETLPHEEVSLTKQMMNTVSNFARNGNPNFGNSTLWPSYTTENRLVMRFDTPVKHAVAQRTTHEDAVIFWHEIIPAAQRRSCHMSPVASALVDFQDEKTESPDRAFILGTWVSASTAEYMLMGLLCISGFLLMIAFVSVVTVLRMKHHRAFHRLSSS